MTAAPTSAVRDPERRKMVRGTELLDSATDEVFDHLTWLAAKLTGRSGDVHLLLEEDRDFLQILLRLV